MIPSLTSAQQQAADEINQACVHNYRDQPHIIVVQGFSGVGKSFVVKSVRDELQQQGHIVLLPEQVRFPQEAVRYLNHAGHIVVAAGFHDADEIAGVLMAVADPPAYGIYDVDWDHIFKRTIHYVDVKGMTTEEMYAYARSRTSRSLDLDALVECSVGLPGLADELMDIAHLNAATARRLSALHLHNNLARRDNHDGYFGRFLNIQPTPDIRAIFDNDFKGSRHKNAHIYDRLPQFREHYAMAQLEEGVTFVAPESIGVYTASLDKHPSQIEMYIPSLNDTDFDAVAAVMGFTRAGKENYAFERKPPRWCLFGVTHKELCIYGRTNAQEFGLAEGNKIEDMYLRRWRMNAETYKRAIETGTLPFPERSGEAMFMVTVNDHGAVNNQPMNLGWMLESFLQQRGIPYIAHNGMCHQWYVFNSAQKKLEFLDNGIFERLNELRETVEREMPY